MICSASEVQSTTLANMLQIISGLLFIGSLIYASIVDLQSRIIPYLACILLALAGLMVFSPANLAGVLLAIPFFLAAGYGQGGAGDTMLVAAAGLTLGFMDGLLGVMLALLLFLLYAGTGRLVCKVRHQALPCSYPLAPFLSIGFLAVYIIQ